MAYASRQGRARVDASAPEAAGRCDRCGFIYSRRDLQAQFQWGGSVLYDTGLLVCDECMDEPQEQLRSIILPADPQPIAEPRPETYVDPSTDIRFTSGQNAILFGTIPVPEGDRRITQNLRTRVTQHTGEPPGGLNERPGTDIMVPDDAGGNDPGLPYNFAEVPETGPLSGTAVSTPSNTVLPLAAGLTAVGSMLSVTDGTWTNNPTDFTYQWRADGTNIGGATSNTYVTVIGQVGQFIDCVVTASNAAGSAHATSNSIGPIASVGQSVGILLGVTRP